MKKYLLKTWLLGILATSIIFLIMWVVAGLVALFPMISSIVVLSIAFLAISFAVGCLIMKAFFYV